MGVPSASCSRRRTRSAPCSLEPFVAIHDERYTVYWPAAAESAEALSARRGALESMDLGTLALDRLTVDSVALGEQQPESDHEFRGADAEKGMFGGRSWRSTRTSMSVILRDPASEGFSIRVGYLPRDETTRVVVLVDGSTVADETVDGGGAAFDLVYPLPPAGPRRTVEFRASGGHSTPGITTVRLLRWA